MSKSKKFMVITTDSTKRGVFGGELVNYDKENNTVILKNAHMAVYWSEKTHGVLGLASIGPQPGSRISPPVPSITLSGVTSVSECTPIAEEQWKKQIWD